MEVTKDYYTVSEKAYVNVDNNIYQIRYSSCYYEKNETCYGCGKNKLCASFSLDTIHADIIDMRTMTPIAPKASHRTAVGKQVIKKLQSALESVYCDDCEDIRWSGEVENEKVSSVVHLAR